MSILIYHTREWENSEIGQGFGKKRLNEPTTSTIQQPPQLITHRGIKNQPLNSNRSTGKTNQCLA